MTASETNRARMMRRQADSLTLRVRKRGALYELRGTDGLVLAAPLAQAEAYVRERYVRNAPGPAARVRPPAAWAPMIDDYLLSLAAGGRPASTMKLRRYQLGRMARELGMAPADVTPDTLLRWMGAHPQWSVEHLRSNRSTVALFFRWGLKTGRLASDPADDLPGVREQKASPRPLPDAAWRTALVAADARTTLILRLAGEAGLRRAEVAQVHRRDLMDSVTGAQLLVHGKGGKKRVVPLSDSLAKTIRRGAPGHTPGAPADGWLFPTMIGGHLTPDHVAQLAQRVLPEPWTLHTLRHRFATRAYRGTRNLRAVQMLLGHASIATTERYTAVDDDEIRAAMMAAIL